MAIITISRESYSWGNTIARRVAEKLGYKTMNREALIEASKIFNIPEIKLSKAIHDAPSVLERFTFGKERYISYIKTALLKHLEADNIVYHGLAGHYFIQGISHALKVRIIADFEDRVKNEMDTEGFSRDEAVQRLKKDDMERMKWGQALYGTDTHDPSLYDLVIHIKTLTVDNAVDLICDTASLPQFKATEQSRKKLEDLIIAAKVKSELVSVVPYCNVTSTNGDILVQYRKQLDITDKMVDEIVTISENIAGVKSVRVEVKPIKYME